MPSMKVGAGNHDNISSRLSLTGDNGVRGLSLSFHRNRAACVILKHEGRWDRREDSQTSLRLPHHCTEPPVLREQKHTPLLEEL